MRILFLTNFYPPADLGGWEQWCQEVADAFAARGHDVWVLTSDFGLEEIVQPEPTVIRALQLESDLAHYRPLDFFLRTGRRDRHNARVARETIARVDPEVIFVWGMWQLDPRLAGLAETLRPGRVAYYFCGYWPIKPDPHTRYWLAAEKKSLVAMLKWPVAQVAMARQRAREDGLPAFRHAAFVSRAVQKILEEGGVVFGNTRVIYGGIDVDRFRRPEGESRRHTDEAPLRILYAGALSEAKGVDTLLRAVQVLAEAYDPGHFQLSLAGAGHPMFEAWARDYVHEAGLRPYVKFLGRLEHEQMATLLKEFDVLAFPSAWQEPLARMMMEGMAAGLALVSTTTGGTGEVVENGVNGLTFEAGDHRQMAGQLARLLVEPGLVGEIAAAGQRTAETLFNFDRMVTELEQFIGLLASRDSDDDRIGAL